MYIFVMHNLYRYEKNALYKGTLQNIILKLLASGSKNVWLSVDATLLKNLQKVNWR